MAQKTEVSEFKWFPYQSAIALPHKQIVEFCQKWKVEEFYLFGSVLRDDFRVNSDVDVMVQFAADARWGFEIVEIKQELEKIFKRKVDLLTKKSVEQSDNWIRKQEILGTAKLMYVNSDRLWVKKHLRSEEEKLRVSK